MAAELMAWMSAVSRVAARKRDSMDELDQKEINTDRSLNSSTSILSDPRFEKTSKFSLRA